MELLICWEQMPLPQILRMLHLGNKRLLLPSAFSNASLFMLHDNTP